MNVGDGLQHPVERSIAHLSHARGHVLIKEQAELFLYLCFARTGAEAQVIAPVPVAPVRKLF